MKINGYWHEEVFALVFLPPLSLPQHIFRPEALFIIRLEDLIEVVVAAQDSIAEQELGTVFLFNEFCCLRQFCLGGTHDVLKGFPCGFSCEGSGLFFGNIQQGVIACQEYRGVIATLGSHLQKFGIAFLYAKEAVL